MRNTILITIFTIFTLTCNAEFTLHGGIGASRVSSEITDRYINLETVKSKGSNITPSLLLGGGYLFNSKSNLQIGLELEVVTTEYKNTESFFSNDYKVKISNISASLLSLKLVQNFEKVYIYGGVGLGIVYKEIYREVPSKNWSKKDEQTSNNFGFTVGASYRFSSKSALFGEVKYIKSNTNSSFNKVGEETKAIFLLFGYRYHFIN